MAASRLHVLHELAFRTQYAELKERVLSAGPLLAGTPGTLTCRTGTGHAYLYRVYYALPGVQAEEFVGGAGDEARRMQMLDRMASAAWVVEQVRSLRQLGFQVADKAVSAVLVQLCRQGLFDAGLCVVGTLAYMATLNELGGRAVAARTQDVDLASQRGLKLATPLDLLEQLRASRLPFVPVPGMPSHRPSTSAKIPGRGGLRVDVLVHGPSLGQTVALTDLSWHAQSVPHLGYLIDAPRDGLLLAGGHAVPVRLPQPVRLAFHKLYSSAQSSRDGAKAAKDLQQAATLLALLSEQDLVDLPAEFAEVPSGMRSTVQSGLRRADHLLALHPEARDVVESLASRRGGRT